MPVTPSVSLDYVVQQAVRSSHAGAHGASHAGVPLSPPLAVEVPSVAAVVSRLAAREDASMDLLPQIPTVQGLRGLCCTFIERYDSLDSLLQDTKWWTRKATHLHDDASVGGSSSVRVEDDMPPCASVAAWSELLQRTTETLRSTHHVAAERRLGDTLHTSSLVSIPKPEVAGGVNVLQFDSVAADSHWESLQLPGSSGVDDGALELTGMPRDEECLYAVEKALHSESIEGGSNISEELDALRYLLRHRPELIVQHEDFSVIQTAVIECVGQHGLEGWVEMAFSLFRSLSVRAQLDFTHAVISALPTPTQGDSFSHGREAQLLRLLLQLLLELPQSWLPLLDSEVTDLFVRVMAEGVVRFGRILSEVDPHASWIVEWSSRPSFSLAVDTLVRAHEPLLCSLVAQLPASHVACVLFYILPQWSQMTGPAQTVEPPLWAEAFHALMEGISGIPSWPETDIYGIATRGLCRCVESLTVRGKERCLDQVKEALMRWKPATKPSLTSHCQFVFALRMLTALLTCDDHGMPWTTARLWVMVDTQLLVHLRALAHAQAAQQPPNVGRPLSTSSRAVSEVVHEACTSLLQRHPRQLPLTLANVVKDAWGSGGSAHQIALVHLSATAEGWVALQPHLLLELQHVSVSSVRWAELLYAIMEVGGGMVDPTTDAYSTTALSSDGKVHKTKRRPPDYLSTFTPRCAALLLRWSTHEVVRDGLVRAARDGLRYFLRRSRRTSAEGHPRWPLQWPVEAYPQTGPSNLSCEEDTFATVRTIRAGVCYQSIMLLLRVTALPSSLIVSSSSAGQELLEDAWAQVEELWLVPAGLCSPHGGASFPSPAGNRPPFGEESLLALISMMAICALVRSSAEYRAWFDPMVAPHRIRQLRRFCEERRGVDPVYFAVRFLTSGKGRKRLPAILLDGFAADLVVDVVCDIDSFTEGEALPVGDLAAAPTAEEVVRVLTAAVPDTKSSRRSSLNSDDATDALGEWRQRLTNLTAALLSHRGALHITTQDIERSLRRRSSEEWRKFCDEGSRIDAVCAHLQKRHVDGDALFHGSGVDIFFLASLCIRSWTRLTTTHSTPTRRKLAWATLQYFCERGQEAYDAMLARSIAAHVERAQRDTAATEDTPLFPFSRPLPLPSALFAALLVRPFALVD